jgi:hypothetical protein
MEGVTPVPAADKGALVELNNLGPVGPFFTRKINFIVLNNLKIG